MKFFNSGKEERISSDDINSEEQFILDNSFFYNEGNESLSESVYKDSSKIDLPPYVEEGKSPKKKFSTERADYTKKFTKDHRRDYFIKRIKVLSMSKWLVKETNERLLKEYGIKRKVQKPSQTFITETNIQLNKQWLKSYYAIQKKF